MASTGEFPPSPSTPEPGRDVRPERRDTTWLAPLAAGVVVVLAVGLLIVLSRDGDAGEPDTTAVPVTDGPDEPRVEPTVPVVTTPPLVTSPPLVEATTTIPVDESTTSSSSTTTTSTTTAPTGGPTVAEVEAALVGLDDLSGDWEQLTPEFDELCGTNPEDANISIERASLFQQTVTNPIGIRQISSTLVSFPDAATAERAFDADVEILTGCDATTIELEGTQYRTQVNADAFDETELEVFACADQSSLITIQLTNDNALVPYLGQSAFGFRCGRNVTVVAYTTTIGFEDLQNTEFLAATSTANLRAGALPGSVA